MAERGTSHSAVALLAERPLPDGRIEATLKLACGCVVTRAVDAARFVDTVQGLRIAAGKYPCPVGHAVSGPGGGA